MRRALILVFALLVPVAPALAQSLPSVNNVYVTGAGGLRIPDNLLYDGTPEDLNFGTTLGASIGVDSSISGVSADIDYLRSTATYSDLGTALDSQSLMVDGLYNLNLNAGFTPYAGVGLGLVNVTYKSADSGNALGYQVKLGVSSPITGGLSWFGEYRYQQALGNVTVGSPTYPIEYARQSILGGRKFSFGGGASPSYGSGY